MYHSPYHPLDVVFIYIFYFDIFFSASLCNLLNSFTCQGQRTVKCNSCQNISRGFVWR